MSFLHKSLTFNISVTCKAEVATQATVKQYDSAIRAILNLLAQKNLISTFFAPHVLRSQGGDGVCSHRLVVDVSGPLVDFMEGTPTVQQSAATPGVQTLGAPQGIVMFLFLSGGGDGLAFLLHILLLRIRQKT